MRIVLFTPVVIVSALATTVRAAPAVELELATERGVQITAPHEWLQLLTSIGVENVRIRGAQPGDEPAVTNRGTADRPRYHVSGILTARNELRLLGGTFARADAARLKDYFEQLTADGAEALTAPRGMFDLTEKEIEAVFADLAQPIEFETKDQPPRAVIERLQARLASKFVLDAGVEQRLRAASPVADELKGLTAGTGLALMLRRDGLAFRPEKSRGQPVVFRVEAGGSPALATTGGPPGTTAATAGKPGNHALKHWPVGWAPQQSPGQTAPSLFEFLNVEIDGYTLEEALVAIGPRLKIPFYLDHAALAAHRIDPATIQVQLPRTRTFYKRVLDRVLSQARLGCEVRIDEAGAPFLWITR